MSSWLGHALGALAIANLIAKEPLDRRMIAAVALTAISPDVLDLVLPGGHPDESHSVLVVIALGVVAWLVCSRERSMLPVLLAASASHLVFDLLANEPKYLLAWPLDRTRTGLAHGSLPAAPGLSLTNFYLYRNLLLEAAIFVPLYLFSDRRRHPRREVLLGALSLATGLFVSTFMVH